MKFTVPSTSEPKKRLTVILKKHSGRDSSGQVSVRHQGGRHKRYYRTIDFHRNKYNQEAVVSRIEYDPNRNAHIALVHYKDGEERYILHLVGMKIGDTVVSGENVEVKVGNSMSLKNIPLGVEVNTIELVPGQGGKLVRGAGNTAVVIAKEGAYVHIKLPSGEVRKFSKDCYATIGVVGNIEHKDEFLGKAGRSRWLGIRPTVRGTAQNPRSHPHGGGEGRSGEGMHPKTPWGKPARGKKTRNRKKWSNKFIVVKRK